MRFRTMVARYPGTCRRCGGAIDKGAEMRYGGRGMTYHLSTDPACTAPTEAADDGPRGWTPGDTGTAYGATSRPPRVVVTTFAGGGQVYRNSRGRCEDAPCCGCCS